MKIVILGASRGTGLLAVKQALAKGYDVTAVARNVVTIQQECHASIAYSSLKISKGDVLYPASFDHELEGADVVISSIGVTNNKPTVLYSMGMINIIHAMHKYNVSRLICVSGIGVEVTPGMPFIMKLATKYILQPLLKNNFSDLLKMEAVVKQSRLNWTIVRAPRLRNGEITGKYRFAANEYLRNPLILRRSDLAHFIVNNIDNKQVFCSRVEISN
ncbi:NAD(P)H-binding protein [Pseudoflavitalea sp. X16]|uniref:NAD(P)-dependent oxidoreductase n=1 Tax=Paraflavitalea devenefica TaxID=2716334 RepID=UPI00141E600B|nr:NAD(P)H-binding protein [Paraflavitalea devenefica]NII26438.1 NAD(P)H-binding protein [Paraflavitalea devenefica]